MMLYESKIKEKKQDKKDIHVVSCLKRKVCANETDKKHLITPDI